LSDAIGIVDRYALRGLFIYHDLTIVVALLLYTRVNPLTNLALVLILGVLGWETTRRLALQLTA